MVDFLNPQERSERMRRIRGTGTRPEVLFRQQLHARGFRYRINARELPGSPDIVLPRWKTVIFVHGCFWHRHRGCPVCTTPKSNIEFWSGKFEKNVRRDKRNTRRLRARGWSVLTVWECEVTSARRLPMTVARIEAAIRRGH